MSGIENLKKIVEVCQDEMRAELQGLLENFQAFCKGEEVKLLATARVWEHQNEVLASYDDYVHLANEAQRFLQGTDENDGSSPPRDVHARGILAAALDLEMDIFVRRVRNDAIIERFQLEED